MDSSFKYAFNEDVMLNSSIKQIMDTSKFFWGDNLTIPGDFENSTVGVMVDIEEGFEPLDFPMFGQTSKLLGAYLLVTTKVLTP